MLGQNPKRGYEKSDGKILKVQNIFLTFQGEGPYVGYPALFIRLGGCNLACNFCDTEFENFEEKSIDEILAKTLNLTRGTKCSLVVLTGGEPLRQNIIPICEILLDHGFRIQIESNGTLYQKLPESVEVVCSPKISNGQYHNIREDLNEYIIGYKFLISQTMEYYNSVPDWDFTGKSVYVQPMDELNEVKNLENNKLAMEISTNRGFIFAIQMHKLVGIE